MLPESFSFSQASLQDFVACPRRFQLRYLLRLRWPAAEVEPIEEHERRMMMGRTFHQMVQQQHLGVPESRIERGASDPDLLRWWQNYCVYRPVTSFSGDAASASARSEVTLSATIAGYRLVAMYDLIVVEPGKRAVILDWKTSDTRTSEAILRERMQTRIYPYLLVQVGAALNCGQLIRPEMVEMIYWFPAFPDAPARLPYDADHFSRDGAFLEQLIERIADMEEDDFCLTSDLRQCEYCIYRSFCDRGIAAGNLDDVTAAYELQEGDVEVDIDFEQIAEIEF